MNTVINTDFKVLEELKKKLGVTSDTREPNIFKYTFEVSFECGVTKTYFMCAETLEEARKDLDEELSHRFESFLGKRTYRLKSVS